VTGSILRNNSGQGIVVGSNSVVANNVCSSNGNGTGAGIATSGGGSDINNNVLIGNAVGVQVSGTGNLIHQNRAHSNSTDYSIANDNDVGPIGSAATSTSSWANISY
jgi:hypothetical protein